MASGSEGVNLVWIWALQAPTPLPQNRFTVWTVVLTVLTATFNSWNRQISTPYKINTPEPIEKKSAQLMTSARGPLYQIWYKSTHWGLLGKYVKYNKKKFYLYLFCWGLPTVRPVDGFLCTIAQKTWNQAKMCLFGVIKLEFNIKSLFIPKNRQNLAQKWT